MSSEMLNTEILPGQEALWMGGRFMIIHHAPEEGAPEPCVSESWINVGQGHEEVRHFRMDFMYHLLEGNMTFEMDGKLMTMRPGNTLFIPRGTPHKSRADGPERSRFFIMATPGRPWVDYVRAIGTPATGPTMPPADFKPVPMEYVKRVAVANGLEFTGGPRLPGASRSGHE